jgi:adenine-specific DNA methylase
MIQAAGANPPELRPTYLEKNFPFPELSRVISADRRSRDPVYGMHRWWARRPPALLRGLLIASHLEADVTPEQFWQAFSSGERLLEGIRVLDPFAGGGSTLVEAARLGAHVLGGDVDPLAVSIVDAELHPPEREPLRKAGAELLDWLTSRFQKLYPANVGALPLHYFHVPLVECATCKHRGPLYRNLVLARDSRRRGAVVRDHGLSCFCPSCFSLHHLNSADSLRLRCCGKHYDLWSGTFAGHSYFCPECSAKASHRDLRTGVAEQRLVAIEETPTDGRRRLRAPMEDDLRALEAARHYLANCRERLHIPAGEVQVGHHDDRPVSYGITLYEQLFTPRQLLVLGSAWAWVADCDWPEPIRRALGMALSNALATNNKLCGYATDYGRLSALFSVRGYSLPALAVELNPLHLTGGRGTIAACIERIERAAGRAPVRRYTWEAPKQRTMAVDFDFTTAGVDTAVACRSADELPPQGAPLDVDICVFDPPYYDYIAYDELSAFYRAWQDGADLAGPPLLPGKGNGAEPFGAYLGRCMHAILARVRLGRPIAFTYHSTNRDAWDAIGDAIDAAELRITAIWPVRSDGHMGHHSHEGNSEWDLVIVCRRVGETEPYLPAFTVDQWIQAVHPLRVSGADRSNMTLAHNMVTSRFARLRRKH